MSPKLLLQMSRVYSALVSALTLYSILVFTRCLPYVGMRGFELALSWAQNVAVLFALLSVLAGILISFVCSWIRVEPPPRLVYFICLAIVVFVFNFAFLPAISVA
jgi:hypothetical protein